MSRQQNSKGMGTAKHRKSGKVHNLKHFSGKKRGNKKTKRRGLTRKQRKLKRGIHKNKYRQN